MLSPNSLLTLDQISNLAEERRIARVNKDYQESDRLREFLSQHTIKVMYGTEHLAGQWQFASTVLKN